MTRAQPGLVPHLPHDVREPPRTQAREPGIEVGGELGRVLLPLSTSARQLLAAEALALQAFDLVHRDAHALLAPGHGGDLPGGDGWPECSSTADAETLCGLGECQRPAIPAGRSAQSGNFGLESRDMGAQITLLDRLAHDDLAFGLA